MRWNQSWSVAFNKVNNMDNGSLVGPELFFEDFLADTKLERNLGPDVSNPISVSDPGLPFSRTFIHEGAIFPLLQNHTDNVSFSAAFQSDGDPLTDNMEEAATGTGEEPSLGLNDNNFHFTLNSLDNGIECSVGFPTRNFSPYDFIEIKSSLTAPENRWYHVPRGF